MNGWFGASALVLTLALASDPGKRVLPCSISNISIASAIKIEYHRRVQPSTNSHLSTNTAERQQPDGFIQRIHRQEQRVHIPIGATCNNRCLFCMEQNGDSRARINGAMTPERVKWIVDAHSDAEELCFTSGEPTLHPELPNFVRMARDAGHRCVSIMTNGRRLGYAPYVETLARAGLNRVYVSIHGPTAAVHDSLTRSPGSFSQTLRGIENAVSIGSLEVHTSTVLSKRSIDTLLATYELIIQAGVDQAVFNGLQVHGGAATHFSSVVPRLRDIRIQFDKMVAGARDGGERAFLVDVPPCVTEGIPDRNRGYMEKRVHYEAKVKGIEPLATMRPKGVKELQSIETRNLEAAFRVHGPKCRGCVYRAICAGVYEPYVRAYGWEEMVPVLGDGGRTIGEGVSLPRDLGGELGESSVLDACQIRDKRLAPSTLLKNMVYWIKTLARSSK